MNRAYKQEEDREHIWASKTIDGDVFMCCGGAATYNDISFYDHKTSYGGWDDTKQTHQPVTGWLVAWMVNIIFDELVGQRYCLYTQLVVVVVTFCPLIFPGEPIIVILFADS